MQLALFQVARDLLELHGAPLVVGKELHELRGVSSGYRADELVDALWGGDQDEVPDVRAAALLVRKWFQMETRDGLAVI